MQWKKYPFGEEFPFFIKRCHFCQDDATMFCKSLPWDEVGEERASTVSAQTCRSPAGFLTEEYIFIKPLGISGKTWRLGLTSVSEAEWGESPLALGRVVHRDKLLPKRGVPENNEISRDCFDDFQASWCSRCERWKPKRWWAEWSRGPGWSSSRAAAGWRAPNNQQRLYFINKN